MTTAQEIQDGIIIDRMDAAVAFLIRSAKVVDYYENEGFSDTEEGEKNLSAAYAFLQQARLACENLGVDVDQILRDNNLAF